MTATYRIQHMDYRGNTKRILPQLHSLYATLPKNRHGIATVNIPINYDFNLIKDWDRLRIYRDGKILGNTDWLILKYGYGEGANGSEHIMLKAYSALYLVNGPIARYPAGDANVSLSDEYSDDMIKTVVRTNCGVDANLTTPDVIERAIPSNIFTVDGPTLEGPIDSKSFSNRRVYDVISDIAVANGITFDVVLENTSPGKLVFKTFYPIRGKNVSDSVIFSKSRKNLKNASITYDFTNETTIAYTAGKDTGVNRPVHYRASDRHDHPFARTREHFISYNLTKDGDILGAESQAYVSAHTPIVIVRGELVDNENTRYGVDWDRGYIVRVEHKQISVDVTVENVSISYANNEEKVISKIEAVIV